MHIAICDDNMGDRKQMERLLKREADSRAATEALYVDSYGNAKAALQSPMLYDAFFIDMVSGDTDGTCLAGLLLDAGVTAPIIFCVSSINYRETFLINPEKDYQNIFYLDKPIRKAELSDMIDICIQKKAESVTTIELRGEKRTYYVTEDDIVGSKAVDNYIHVFLKDGTELEILSTLDNFYAQLEAYSHYISISSKAMVNITYVSNVGMFKITLKDGTVLRTTPSYSRDIKKALQE